MRLDLDCLVDCTDGGFGELADVVIDPSTHRLTHLVVQPPHRHELARLVPMAKASVDRRTQAGVSLDCTVAELNQLEPVQASKYLRLGERPDQDPDFDVGIQEVFELPPSGSLGADALGAGMPPELDAHVTLRYDRIPTGTVELRRQSAVTSSDGHHVGHVVGIIVDDEQRIAQLVLEHGHLWNKREIQIPIASIDHTESDEVVLTLSSDEVGR